MIFLIMILTSVFAMAGDQDNLDVVADMNLQLEVLHTEKDVALQKLAAQGTNGYLVFSSLYHLRQGTIRNMIGFSDPSVSETMAGDNSKPQVAFNFYHANESYENFKKQRNSFIEELMKNTEDPNALDKIRAVYIESLSADIRRLMIDKRTASEVYREPHPGAYTRYRREKITLSAKFFGATQASALARGQMAENDRAARHLRIASDEIDRQLAEVMEKLKSLRTKSLDGSCSALLL